jgi:hypothetical protein
MAVQLYPYQKDAIEKLRNGNILVGGVGSGKSLTSLAYYLKECGGDFNNNKLQMKKPKDLYIITTARKRDTLEWEKECSLFKFSIKVTVDSWNNIRKYVNVKNAFFILDEQRVIGNGTWVKSFIKVTKNNNWILLSATPGDTWSDYIPVFVANGYYKNRTEFIRRHVVFNNFSKFPKIDHYIEINRLVRLRDEIIINMHYNKRTISNDKLIKVGFDREIFNTVMIKRWNVYEKEPVRDVAQLCYLMRRVVNSDPRRVDTVAQLIKKHPKVIVFYNFNYERELLLELGNKLKISTTEWNGHNHQLIPDTNEWMYIVQYAAGAEGWNCILTDTVIFYSQNYSYKAVIQAAGRIDRLNSPFTNLYYYHLYSTSEIDLAIRKAFNGKKNFNEKRFIS